MFNCVPISQPLAFLASPEWSKLAGQFISSIALTFAQDGRSEYLFKVVMIPSSLPAAKELWIRF
jgi:hypothetical protein